MKYTEIEELIDIIYENKHNIVENLTYLALYKYYHHGIVFSYAHSITSDVNVHLFTKNSIVIFSVDALTGSIRYYPDDLRVDFPLDIEEDWHFQLSTQKPVLPMDYIQKIKEIVDILPQS